MTSPIFTTGDGGYRVREISVKANRNNEPTKKGRRPFPQINSFRDWVLDELVQRRTEYPTPIRAPFVRMTSCNQDDVHNYKYFSLGLHGYDNQDTNIFDSTYGSKRDIVGYAYRDGRKALIGSDEITYVPAYNDTSAEGTQTRAAIDNRVSQAQAQQDVVPAKSAHPIPGITSVSIRRSGLADPFHVHVHWQCYNQQQMEFLRNHFLVVGNYIVVEWGQKSSNSKNSTSKYLNFADPEVLKELVNTITYGRNYVVDGVSNVGGDYVHANRGNYDYAIGQVSNFTVDFDPTMNIYKCSTELVSMGENVWGLNLASTATVIVPPGGDETQLNRSHDVHSYFQPGGGYDTMLKYLESFGDGTKFTRPVMPPFKESAQTSEEVYKVGPNPQDNSFITWSTFANDVMDDIIASFQDIDFDNSEAGQKTKSMYDKLRNDLRALLGLGVAPSEALSDEIYIVQRKLYNQEWVGNHPLLRTVDPNVMVIITPEIYGHIDPLWKGAGVFGDTDGEESPGIYAGKLSHGVWLNTEMIRRAFLDTETLQSAIQKILTQMNLATANYWQLRLFYDDEINVYKIIDYKFDHETTSIPMYVFNSRQNAQHNETVDIKFDTAFPPELITQMMAVAMIHTKTPQEQAEYFKNYPLINNTSPFMVAVNWTSLTDVLNVEVSAKRNSMRIAVPRQTSKTVPHGTASNETTDLANSTRIGSDGYIGPATGDSPSDAGKAGTARTLPGSPKQTTSDATQVAPKPNTTAFPPSTSDPFRLQSQPLKGKLEITSPYGSRTSGTGDAVRRSTFHKGVDLRAAQGTAIYATNAGTVTKAYFDKSSGLGVIEIMHGTSGYTTRYLHVSGFANTLNVAPTNTEQAVANLIGQYNPGRVAAGDLIGYSGGKPGTLGAGDGLSDGPHLHFMVLKNGTAIDPTPLIRDVDGRGTTLTERYYDDPTPKELTFPFSSPNISQSSDADVGPIATTKTPTKPQTAEDKLAEKNKREYTDKFGDGIKELVWFTPSILRNLITSDGYKNLNDNMVNAFISPFPTKTSVELKIPGISGISISDAFMVDKLPFIFADYGAFQTTEITDAIDASGWYTNIRGYFKMLWPAGTGGTRVD